MKIWTRILGLTSSTLAMLLVLAVACTSTPESLPCEINSNCLDGESCIEKTCQPSTGKPDAGKPDAGKPDVAKKPDNSPVDQGKKDDTSKPEPKVDKAKEKYPPGPYSADVDKVVIPLTLKNCTTGMTHSFHDLYKHPTIKVILLTVHTLW